MFIYVSLILPFGFSLFLEIVKFVFIKNAIILSRILLLVSGGFAIDAAQKTWQTTITKFN